MADLASAQTDDKFSLPNGFRIFREKRQEKLQKIRSASQYFENESKAGAGNVENQDEIPSDSESLLQEPVTTPTARHTGQANISIQRSKSELTEQSLPISDATRSCWRFLSILYALILIVLGTAFPLSEIISDKIPILFYQKFYLYLYGTSLVFLVFAYVFLLESGCRQTHRLLKWIRQHMRWGSVKSDNTGHGLENHNDFESASNYTAKTGSFFLRMGAILFGIGSMLYSCLEFGQYFELKDTSDECGSVMAVVTPAFRFAFSFVQLYFVFTNSRIRNDRFVSFTGFGLMHMLATNICIWLNVLMEETKHELHSSDLEEDMVRQYGFYIASLNDKTAITNGTSENYFMQYFYADQNSENITHSCRSRTTVGTVLQRASPFLYPCIVEHSLICAALTYVMWSGLNQSRPEPSSTISEILPRRKLQQYTVDCHGATRGLFIGLLMSLMTIISMILFFVWIYIWRENYYSLSVLQAYIVETILYSTTLIAVGVAFFRLRRLKFVYSDGSKLDDVLLVISQMGVYVFPTFILISGHHTIFKNPTQEDWFGIASTLLETVQSTAQTLFLLDATRRRSTTERHWDDKPGREFVMFLLVCNFNLWAIDSLEAWRQQLYPQQIRFYGTWTWTLITHISMPLTIFFRFHSSVCLSEVWKSAYKNKNPPADEELRTDGA